MFTLNDVIIDNRNILRVLMKNKRTRRDCALNFVFDIRKNRKITQTDVTVELDDGTVNLIPFDQFEREFYRILDTVYCLPKTDVSRVTAKLNTIVQSAQ